MDQKSYTLDDLPQDAVVNTGQAKEYAPIDPSEMYQVEISKVELRDNPYYRPDAENPEERGSKYQISFEFTILNEGEFTGRKLWRKTSLSLMPMTRKGEPSILYKIVTSALNRSMDWDECSAYATDIKYLMHNLNDMVVGKQVKVAIENVTNPETKKVKSNIKAFYPVKEAMQKSETTSSVDAKDLDAVLAMFDGEVVTGDKLA